ncbi:MAG: hypothetical protein ACI93R_000582 [Flavobacteriales bacterium]|jgi:hypothetical protein
MKITFIVLGVVVLLVGGLFAGSRLTLEDTTISARYEMLACEGCNHMAVEKSKDANLNGKTIIPVSSTVDIEQLIDSIALTKEPLCLRGKPYRFNWNLFGIDPDGIKFEVTAKENPEVCAGL